MGSRLGTQIGTLFRLLSELAAKPQRKEKIVRKTTEPVGLSKGWSSRAPLGVGSTSPPPDASRLLQTGALASKSFLLNSLAE